MEKTAPGKSRFRFTRLAAIAAVLCVLLGTTVFAAEVVGRRIIPVREEGRIRHRFSYTNLMEFTVSDQLSGAEVHHMELQPKGYYHFGKGMIYHPTEGFLKVTENYELEAMDFRTLFVDFEKNGRTYELDMAYVRVDGGIYSNLLNFYSINNEEILINITAEGSHAWPVYVNIQTGEIRDALPAFSDADFLPAEIENGFDARLAYTQPFRDGILISSLVSGDRNGKTDSKTLRYWVKNGTNEVTVLDLPQNSIDYVIDGMLYYQDRDGLCYVMDENFGFIKVDASRETTDNLNCGLLTVCSQEGNLEIVDVVNQVIYFAPDIRLEGEKLWDTTGYNATRHSTDGRIVVTHSYTDWEEGNRPVDRISYLDVEAGVLRQLHIDADCHVQTHGWLDDNRYCVVYLDGLKRYLSVYEFA